MHVLPLLRVPLWVFLLAWLYRLLSAISKQHILCVLFMGMSICVYPCIILLFLFFFRYIFIVCISIVSNIIKRLPFMERKSAAYWPFTTITHNEPKIRPNETHFY